MKHTYIFVIALIVLLLNSCTVDTKNSFHKDNTQSMRMDIDMKEFLDMYKTFANDDDENFEQIIENVKKLPKNWVSVYDAGNTMFSEKVDKIDTDTVRMLKKLMIQSNYDENDFKGISIKFDRFDKKNVNLFNSFLNDEQNHFPLPTATLSEINGKKTNY